jgi:hypothetical protein
MTITKMDVAKEAANLVVSVAFGSVISSAITRTSDSLNEDDTTVRVASTLGGWYLANRYREQTDAMVEEAAAKLSNMRESFRNRKSVQA